jgi:hypothetical protein
LSTAGLAASSSDTGLLPPSVSDFAQELTRYLEETATGGTQSTTAPAVVSPVPKVVRVVSRHRRQSASQDLAQAVASPSPAPEAGKEAAAAAQPGHRRQSASQDIAAAVSARSGASTDGEVTESAEPSEADERAQTSTAPVAVRRVSLAEAREPSPLMLPSRTFRVAHDHEMQTRAPQRDLTERSVRHLHSRHVGEAEYGAFASYEAPPDGDVASTVAHIHGQKNVTRFTRLGALLTSKRVPYTQWTLGQLLATLVFVLVNLVCLLVVKKPNSAEPDFKRGFGSLAAANTLLLIIPATRNSVLTWLLRLPFDQVLPDPRGSAPLTVPARRSSFITAHLGAGRCSAHLCTVGRDQPC